MSYEPPPSASPTNRTLIIVLVILAGMIILGVAGCAGLGLLGLVWSSRAALEAREEAEVARAEALQAEVAARRAADEAAARGEPERLEARRWLPSTEERAAAEATSYLFMMFIRDDRLDDAYGLTSIVFRKERDRDAFGKFVAEHPGLLKELHPHGMVQPDKPGEKVIGLRFMSSMSGGVRVEVKFKLSKENDFWLIDRIDIREDKVGSGS